MTAATLCLELSRRTRRPAARATNRARPRLAAERLTGPITALLRELADVLGHLDDGAYVQCPVGTVSGSIGGHVRHTLDHVRALADAAYTGRLDFDHRARGTPVEADRRVALTAIAELVAAVRAVPDGAWSRPVDLPILVCADGEPLQFRSTLAREAAYVVSHTIHHHALIAAMVRTLGGWVPERFGYAPSTLAHLEAPPCAR